jgi:ribosomal protein S20
VSGGHQALLSGCHRHPHAAQSMIGQHSPHRPIRQTESLIVANIKSQKKRILTNEKARLRNNAIKSELKTATRRVKEAVEAQNKEAAEEALRFVSRKLDKAVSKGVLHKKNAANKKSGLAHLVNKLS